MCTFNSCDSPENGIFCQGMIELSLTRRLIKVVQVAARKREIRYLDLQNIGRGVRRHFHDNSNAVVVFLNTPINKISAHSICSVRAGE